MSEEQLNNSDGVPGGGNVKHSKPRVGLLVDVHSSLEVTAYGLGLAGFCRLKQARARAEVLLEIAGERFFGAIRLTICAT